MSGFSSDDFGNKPSKPFRLRRNDIHGARDAGCFAWLWGLDVRSLEDLADRILLPDADSLRMV